jgi:hypothetical protein
MPRDNLLDRFFERLIGVVGARIKVYGAQRGVISQVRRFRAIVVAFCAVNIGRYDVLAHNRYDHSATVGIFGRFFL